MVWIRYSLQEVFEELPRGFSISLVDQSGDRKLARSVNADKEIQFPFSGLHLGHIDMKEANRVTLELLGLSRRTSSSFEIPCRCKQR